MNREIETACTTYPCSVGPKNVRFKSLRNCINRAPRSTPFGVTPQTSNALMSSMDPQRLKPVVINAASTQADLTSTFRAASCAVPYGCVASNALTYLRPCISRTPKALPPMNSASGTAHTEIIEATRAIGRNHAKGTLNANSRKMSVATARPIVSTGKPLVFNSNHACARVADDTGHGKRTRLISHSGKPADLLRDSVDAP